MTRFYKARNKRLIARGRRGRFRKTTLADIGMSTCEGCGAIFAPDYSAARRDGFVDPRVIRDLQKTCPGCKAKENEEGAEG